MSIHQRILDRNYDGRPIWQGPGRPFTEWMFPEEKLRLADAPYQAWFWSTDESGKWCWDCTKDEADRVWPLIQEATRKGLFATCLRTTPRLAEFRDGYELVLAFTGSKEIAELKRSLKLLRELGVTGDVFWKSDARTTRCEPGYDFTSAEVESADDEIRH